MAPTGSSSKLYLEDDHGLYVDDQGGGVVEDPDDKDDDDTKRTPSEVGKLKYYASLFLGTLSIACVFAFLFLVPFVLDPAISTLLHEFVDEPATCKVNFVHYHHGKNECLWSSCREGCTADMYQCYQVRVMYSQRKWKNGTLIKDIPESEWIDLDRYDDIEEKVMKDTPLLVNIKGCGYPPDITCPLFVDKYEHINEKNETFPCYYSRVNPWIVLEHYDYSESMGWIITSIAVPNGIFAIALIVLLFWYCPFCQTRCNKYEEQTNVDEKEEDLEEEDEPTGHYK